MIRPEIQSISDLVCRSASSCFIVCRIETMQFNSSSIFMCKIRFITLFLIIFYLFRIFPVFWNMFELNIFIHIERNRNSTVPIIYGTLQWRLNIFFGSFKRCRFRVFCIRIVRLLKSNFCRYILDRKIHKGKRRKVIIRHI